MRTEDTANYSQSWITSSEQRSDLLEIVDLMYQRGSIIVVSQLPVDSWYKMIGDSTHADAILDRLVHGSIKIELKGESMRKMQTSLTNGDQWSYCKNGSVKVTWTDLHRGNTQSPRTESSAKTLSTSRHFNSLSNITVAKPKIRL